MHTRTVLMAMALVTVTSASAGWNFSAGPAWRATVKADISGRASSDTGASTSGSYDRDVPNKTDWTAADVAPGNVVEVQDPDYPGIPTLTKWAAMANYTEVSLSPIAGSTRLSGSDERGMMGLKASLGYDFDLDERFSLGADMRFAGYWGLKANAMGVNGGGVKTTRTWTDYFLFSGVPVPPDDDFGGATTDGAPYLPYRQDTGLPVTETVASPGYVSARIRSDLYQLGIGPKLTWHALAWLDVYGCVRADCNLAIMDFDVGTSGSSDTKCLFGVSGNVGFNAYITDCLGIYGEVGYEWVDKATTDFGTSTAEVDYSSFVVSVGLVYRF